MTENKALGSRLNVILTVLFTVYCFLCFSQTEEVLDTLRYTNQKCPIIYSGYKEDGKRNGEWKTYVACHNKSDTILRLDTFKQGRLKSSRTYNYSRGSTISKMEVYTYSLSGIFSNEREILRKAYYEYNNDVLRSSSKRCALIPIIWKRKIYDQSGNLIEKGFFKKKVIEHYGELGPREIYVRFGKWRKYDAEGNLIEVKKYRNGEVIKTKIK